MARPKYPSDRQDQFMLRMPDGLRTRIKAYADEHGRSMNAEIVRVLEREFPEPWPLESRIGDLIELAKISREVFADDAVDRLSEELYETLRGALTGRLKGIDEATRQRIEERLGEWEVAKAEDEHARRFGETDQGEFDVYGGTQKV